MIASTPTAVDAVAAEQLASGREDALARFRLSLRRSSAHPHSCYRMTIVMYCLTKHMTIVMVWQLRKEMQRWARTRVARLLAGRLHYSWVVVGMMFMVILATVGVRAAPSVLIVPLQKRLRLERARRSRPRCR